MKKAVQLAALAAAALVAGQAHAATTIFAQDFSHGLGANEQVGGKFAVGAGTVGHQSTYYSNNEYSFYQFTLDLTQVADAMLRFDFDVSSEWTWDGMNLVAGTGGVFSKSGLLLPTHAGVYDRLQGRAGTLMGAQGISGISKGVATFDLSSLYGKVVDIRFQFASDQAAIGEGVDIDNIVVTSASMVSGVPEPATWAMMITGFGLAGGAIRRRRQGWMAAAA